MTTRVLVLGSGKRVREAALPAFVAIGDAMQVERVFARTVKQIDAGGRSWDVEAFEGFRAADLEGIGLVYIAVGKGAVPDVLTQLVRHDLSDVDVFIDTPVVRFKYFCHASKLRRFRHAWVSEDCITLPWIDAVRAATEAVGPIRRVLFDRSAYAYHGVATAKELLGSRCVVSASRQRIDGGAMRHLTFENGGVAEMREPRDYATGHVVLAGASGTISDLAGAADHVLRPVVERDEWTGFRVGDFHTELDDAERSLLRGMPSELSITARMDDLKRVGFLRLLRRIADGTGAYPLEDALDDMFVDYHLEKLGRYRANPFTSYRSPLARAALGLVTRLGG